MGKHHWDFQCLQCSNNHNQRQKPQTEVPSHQRPPVIFSQNSYRFHLKIYRRVNHWVHLHYQSFWYHTRRWRLISTCYQRLQNNLYFLWASDQDKIPVTVLVPQADGLSKQLLDKLTEKHILSLNIAPPNPNNVAGPSVATLNPLSGNIHFLTNIMETESK